MCCIYSTLNIRFVYRFAVNGHDIPFNFHRVSSHRNDPLNKIPAFRRHMEYNNLTPLRRADIIQNLIHNNPFTSVEIRLH
ncbi:hypothetical protein D3C80_1869340 [compost metagenome]